MHGAIFAIRASNAHVANELQHGADVLQFGHVAQYHGLGREQGCAKFWQGCVFGARDFDLAIQRMTTLDDEFVHFERFVGC